MNTNKRDPFDPVAMAERFAYFNDREPTDDELRDYMRDSYADRIDQARDEYKERRHG